MAIFDELKSIGKILQEAGKIELYQQVLNIQEKLLEMHKKIVDLENERKELKEKLRIKSNLVYENNTYWIQIEDDKKDGPFCSHCWDKNKELIRMHPCGNPAYSQCPECKEPVQLKPDINSHHNTAVNFDPYE
jgi:hypothetical protein